MWTMRALIFNSALMKDEVVVEGAPPQMPNRADVAKKTDDITIAIQDRSIGGDVGAQWAVFFDAAGIEWTYEPEGYTIVFSSLPSAAGPHFGKYTLLRNRSTVLIGSPQFTRQNERGTALEGGAAALARPLVRCAIVPYTIRHADVINPVPRAAPFDHARPHLRPNGC